MNAKPKTKWLRSPEYLAWVRTQPSAISGQFGCVAHHLIGHGRCGTQKTHDYWAIPLTDAEHKELHDKGWRAWEMENFSQWTLAANTLEDAVNVGVLDVVNESRMTQVWALSRHDDQLCHGNISMLESGELTLNKKAALGRENIF